MAVTSSALMGIGAMMVPGRPFRTTGRISSPF